MFPNLFLPYEKLGLTIYGRNILAIEISTKNQSGSYTETHCILIFPILNILNYSDDSNSY